jgi:uncharacterized protein (UPF0332 family)
MNPQEALERVIALWLDKADRSLAAARDELAAGRSDFAVNRVYYACFYALSALLLKEGRRFVKHAGVRGAMHQHLVKTGRLSAALADFYDAMFQARHEADYGEVEVAEVADVAAAIPQAERFVAEMKRFLGTGTA